MNTSKPTGGKSCPEIVGNNETLFPRRNKMTRFAPDLKAAHAGMLILERGEYEFEVTKSTPFFYVKDDGTEVAGVRAAMEVAGRIMADGSLDTDADYIGENAAPMRLFVHTPKSFAMTKQCILAAMGYDVRDETQANEEYFDGADFSIDGDDDDPDNVEVIGGASWNDMVGKRLRMTADVNIWQGREQQQYRSYQPIK